MYLLDPQEGPQRRARLKDRLQESADELGKEGDGPAPFPMDTASWSEPDEPPAHRHQETVDDPTQDPTMGVYPVEPAGGARP